MITLDSSSFGADLEGVIDSTGAFIAAVNAAYADDRVLVIPPGILKVSRTILIPEGLKIVGAGSGAGYAEVIYTANPSLALLKKSGATVIYLAAGADCPMFELDSTRATERNTETSVYDGRGTVSKKYFNVEFADLVLHGNARSQTRHDCDLIKATDAWGITLNRVQLIFAAGFTANFWNCNVVRINDVIAQGDLQKSRGMLLFDCGDCIFGGESMAGGFVAPALWVATPTGWLNNFSGLHFGDNQNIETGGEILSVADDVMTLSQDPRIETGQPVIFWNHSFDAGAALPTGINRGQVYFAIKLTATTYGFAETLPNAHAGTKSAISDIGTKTWLKCGPSVCLYLSQAVKNVFTNCRWDNGRDGGVILEDSSNNVFNSCLITKPGGGTSLDRVGLWHRSGSNNIFDDLSFADCKNPIRVDDGANYFGHYVRTNCTNQPSFSAGTTLLVTQTAAGNVALTGQLAVNPGAGVIPLALTATDTPTVATFTRAGSVNVAMVMRLTENADGVGADALYIADVNGAHIGGFSGSSTLAQFILGGDGLTAASKTLRIRGGLSTGTNIAGNDVELTSGGGTGNAAPGALKLKIPTRLASGVSQQTTLATILEVSETAVDASKPFLPPRMTKAQRNALTASEGMVVMQTDSTPGLRVYQSGAWVAPNVTADP